MMIYVLFLCSYLLGSIPFGLLLTKYILKKDITQIGSGNIGATNVLRTGNKKLAALTLFLDFLKGAIAVGFLGSYYGFLQAYFSIKYPHPAHLVVLLIGIFAILGHCFPVWLKFRGGKGVATTYGVLFAAVPFTGIVAALTWLSSAAVGRISSLAAISAMIVAPATTWMIYGSNPALVNALISALVLYRHKENIARMRKGEEPRIGKKK